MLRIAPKEDWARSGAVKALRPGLSHDTPGRMLVIACPDPYGASREHARDGGASARAAAARPARIVA